MLLNYEYNIIHKFFKTPLNFYIKKLKSSITVLMLTL